MFFDSLFAEVIWCGCLLGSSRVKLAEFERFAAVDALLLSFAARAKPLPISFARTFNSLVGCSKVMFAVRTLFYFAALKHNVCQDTAHPHCCDNPTPSKLTQSTRSTELPPQLGTTKPMHPAVSLVLPKFIMSVDQSPHPFQPHPTWLPKCAYTGDDSTRHGLPESGVPCPRPVPV